MKVLIENVSWHLSEEIREGTVIFSVNGREYFAFSCGPDYRVGEVMEVELSHLEGKTDWKQLYERNLEGKKCLIQTGAWSYEGYGQLISVNPVVADFGDFVLELGDWSNDKKLIGGFIFIEILRLDIWPKE